MLFNHLYQRKYFKISIQLFYFQKLYLYNGCNQPNALLNKTLFGNIKNKKNEISINSQKWNSKFGKNKKKNQIK